MYADGIDGLLVRVEVDVSRGLPAFHLVGLPSAAVRESRERVVAAIRNSGYELPLGRVTVNLAPAGIRKDGACFDLAIALGVIAAGSSRDSKATEVRSRTLLLGELSLFGELRHRNDVRARRHLAKHRKHEADLHRSLLRIAFLRFSVLMALYRVQCALPSLCVSKFGLTGI